MSIRLDDLKHLTLPEKLKIVDFLWDDIRDRSAPQLSDEDWAETRRRDEELRNHPERALTLDEMWARVDEKMDL